MATLLRIEDDAGSLWRWLRSSQADWSVAVSTSCLHRSLSWACRHAESGAARDDDDDDDDDDGTYLQVDFYLL